MFRIYRNQKFRVAQNFEITPVFKLQLTQSRCDHIVELVHFLRKIAKSQYLDTCKIN